MFVLPAIAGVAIGILSGLLGIGGGTVMVPIFRLAFGMSPSFPRPRRCSPLFPRPYRARHPIYAIKRASCRLAWRQASAERSPRLWGVWLAQISPAWMIMVAAALIIGWSAVKCWARPSRCARRTARNSMQRRAARSSRTKPPSSV